METNLTKYRKDLNRLIAEGRMLIAGMFNELGASDYMLENIVDVEDNQFVQNHSGASFSDRYQIWYSESYELIRQVLPSRLDDFASYYKKPKGTSGLDLSKYLIDTCRMDFGRADETYFRLYQQQYLILKSVASRFESSLYDIKQLLQADVFDSEIDSAKELCKKGFYRAAGAICGVVIEKHLSEVCTQHQIKVTKKNPTINDYNELLKANNIVDIATWRNIQRLADVRNMCDHHKDVEPTKDNIEELIAGTDKMLKTIF